MAGFWLDRTNEDVKRELSEIIFSLKDPRITGVISVVRVQVSRDLSLCRAYISSLDGSRAAGRAAEVLNGAAGYIRRELAHRVRLRKTPELKFIADDSIEHGARINEVLHSLEEKKSSGGDEQEGIKSDGKRGL